jgi:glycosyltransferase involved in cell wall biosynthesis
MLNVEKKRLEILLSTMQRTSLSFLSEMFPEDDFLNFNILIINQTTKDKLLKSNYDNIRIINSFEKGLSLSRNIAIKNAKKEICLFTDDDVKYVRSFEEIILSSFNKHKKADVITFQMIDDKGKLFKNYPDIVEHDKKSVNTVNSVVIAFKRQRLIDKNVLFNCHFGLGSTFQTADEYIFLRNALKATCNILFEPQIILSHSFYSSGKAVGSDKVLYARSAVFYKYSGVLSYLRLCKHLFLIYKSKDIGFKEVFKKYYIGLKGINKYRQLLKQGLEER